VPSISLEINLKTFSQFWFTTARPSLMLSCAKQGEIDSIKHINSSLLIIQHSFTIFDFQRSGAKSSLRKYSILRNTSQKITIKILLWIDSKSKQDDTHKKYALQIKDPSSF
jgi:hypothetical protein